MKQAKGNSTEAQYCELCNELYESNLISDFILIHLHHDLIEFKVTFKKFRGNSNYTKIRLCPNCRVQLTMEFAESYP